MEDLVPNNEELLRVELKECLVFYKNYTMIKNKFIHQIYLSKPNSKTLLNSQTNRHFDNKSNEYNKYLEDKDYDSIVGLLIERPWRLSWFNELKETILNDKGEMYYYKLLSNVYNGTENAYEYKDILIELFQFGNNPLLMMNEEESLQFQNLPNRFNVWRGVGIKDDFVEEYIGASWTTDYNRAKFFANRNVNNEGYPLVFELEINKNEILSYLTRREENEVLLDFTTIDEDKLKYIHL